MFSRTIWLIFLCLALSPAIASAQTPLCAFDRQYVTTDPKTGLNTYRSWIHFPAAATEYRKMVMLVSLQCPDKLMCGEWDYCDHINIKRIGGKNAPEITLEIGRVLTPYGRRFGPDWRVDWQLDVTDYASLLHDSVEVEYQHSGYEPANDRGWLLTLCFDITKGPAPMRLLAIDTVFHGSVPYGDSSKAVENYLREFIVKPSPGAASGRLRILQTGHGMDEPEGCAEFCAKRRDIWWDGKVAFQKLIWKECASNPLYPQAGTWIFDRANWCPGELNTPDAYDFHLDGNPHSLRIAMQAYHSPKPSAQYRLSAYFLQFAKARYARDAELSAIITPSALKEYSRRGEVTDSPRVAVKNLGHEKITSLEFQYGYDRDMRNVYRWQGSLAPGQSMEICLPRIYLPAAYAVFEARIARVNNKKDEHPADNSLTSAFVPPPTLPGNMVIFLQTNGEAMHNSMSLRNAASESYLSYPQGSLDSNRIYRDTLILPDGLYTLAFHDTAGDGLEFWYNAKGGKGILRLMTRDGHLLKNFNPDFGNDIRFTFRVKKDSPIIIDTTAIIEVFPIRNEGKFFLDVFFDKIQEEIRVEVLRPDSTIALERRFIKVKDGRLNLDITALPDAIYILKIFSQQGIYYRRVKLVKKS